MLNRLFFFTSSKKSRPKKTSSTIVESAELKTVWLTLRNHYFPDRLDLDTYQVSWSRRRQKRTLASCNITQRRVVVAREMNFPPCLEWWEPLLYHEMCHAVLGEDVQQTNERKLWHGAQFRELEARHPLIPALNAWVKSGGWFSAVMRERGSRRHGLTARGSK